MESFNGKLLDECLNQNVFSSLTEARNILEEWRKDYNCKRPHRSLGWLIPNEYRQIHQLSNQAGNTNLLLVS